ncbi:CBO0543 family protein [Paenibacillus prosopidis]
MYVTCAFSGVIQFISDFLFILKYDWYGYFYHGSDFYGLFIVYGVYPPFTIIYLNFYPYGRKWSKQLSYILFYTFFAIFYEWTAVLSGYFFYNGWKLWYSAMWYPPLLALLAFHYRLVMRYTRKYSLS